MTKEEILNGMSEQEFYDMYPDQESWENAQQMKLGGLSGAPHNGQPTADEFFNYGSHANDAVNIPMSNPFFAAHGGTPYYGGPIRPYQKGGTSDYDNKYKEARKQDSTYYDPQYDVMKMFTTGSFDNYDAINTAKKYGYVGGSEDFFKKQKELYDNPDRLGMIEGQEAAYRAYQKGTHKPVALTNDQVGQLGKLYEQYGDSWETDSPMYGKSTYNFKENLSPYDYKRVKSMGEWYKERHKKYGGYMDMGGNTASPMNYGAFNIPMQYGGYEQEYGGVIDPGNNQDYPILEEGGKSALMSIIKAHSKKMKKAYQEGGDTVMQGGNSDDYPTNLTNTFKNILKQNIQNHMINEEEKNFSNEMMQMGGYQGPGMNYGATNFSQPNQQNQALVNMYQQRIGATKDNLSNDFSNLGNATSYLGATANPYQKTSVKAQNGIQVLLNKQTGKPFSADEYSEYEKYFGKGDKKETSTTDESTDNSADDSKYNRYYNQRGMDYAPMNYNPYTRISKTDDALLRQLAANPSSNLKSYSNFRAPLGFGRTKMTFGYKDQAPLLGKNENIKDKTYIPSAESNITAESNAIQNNNNQSNDQGNDPYADYKYNPYNPASQNPRNTESWFSKIKTVIGDKRNNTPKEDFQGESWFSRYKGMKAGQREDRNRLKRLEEQDRQVGPYVSPEEEMAYGGGLRRYQGLTGSQVDNENNTGLASNNMFSGNSFQPSGNAPGAAPSLTTPSLSPSAPTVTSNNNQTPSNPTSFSSGWNFAGSNTSTPTPQSAGVAQTPITTTGVQAPKVVPEKNKIGSPMGEEKEATVTTKNRPGFDKEAMANWSIAGINTLAGGLEQAQNAKNQKQLSNLQLADNAFMATPANAQSRGDYDPNSGMFRMDQMNPVQFPGGMGYSAYGGAMYQEGGMQEEMQAQPQQAQPDPQQIMEGVAAMLQQGAQPEQIAEQLVEMGIPQEQVMQIIQAVMQQMQGGQEQPMQPAMRYGGYAMGGYQDEDSYEDDLNEDEIAELRSQGYNVEYLD